MSAPLPAMSDAERDRVIRAIQFKIEKLRDGLGMPPDPEALAGYEALLERVQADRRAAVPPGAAGSRLLLETIANSARRPVEVEQ